MLVTASPLQNTSEHDINIWKRSGEVEKVLRRFLISCLVFFFLKSFVMIVAQHICGNIDCHRNQTYNLHRILLKTTKHSTNIHNSSIYNQRNWRVVNPYHRVILGKCQRLESSCFMGGWRCLHLMDLRMVDSWSNCIMIYSLNYGGHDMATQSWNGAPAMQGLNNY